MKRRTAELDPEDIFLDSRNLPAFDRSHLEGRIERPLPPATYRGTLFAALFLGALLFGQTFYLTIMRHSELSAWASDNQLVERPIIAQRGRILDRNGIALAENESASSTPTRAYPLGTAAAHLVGYVSYPKTDKNGIQYQEGIVGVSGIEAQMDAIVSGRNGLEIIEIDVSGAPTSGSVVRMPVAGNDVSLSIDADLQRAVFDAVKKRVDASFIGGAAGIMDVATGELLALVSYPSYDPVVLSSGEPRATIESYQNDVRTPFVDRAVTGLYAPGSIIKPFVAVAALEEKVVTEHTTYVSTGQLVVPNPFNPEKPSIFRDWRAHGPVDLVRALAVSSDVYFYIVGGGFESQRGLGIDAIDRYAALFGFGVPTQFGENDPSGVVPTPAWKREQFNGDDWRVGDTYISSIGQFGWQVTLLQSLRATAALTTNSLIEPTIQKETSKKTPLMLSETTLALARAGMRRAVTEGTATALNIPGLPIAAKTGTAEVGAAKEYTNSLVIGLFPAEKPRYAFAVILERSKAGTVVGAPAVMREIFDWLKVHRPNLLSTEVAERAMLRYNAADAEGLKENRDPGAYPGEV